MPRGEYGQATPCRRIIRGAMKMEFDSKQIHRYLSLIKNLEAQMMTYRVVYEYAVNSGRFPELPQRLEQAREVSQVEANRKYDEALQTL
jgi:hypothetical protein